MIGVCACTPRDPASIGDYLAIPARHDLRQIVERGVNERAWKPYAQKPTPTEQILFLKVQNAYDVVAGGQSDLGRCRSFDSYAPSAWLDKGSGSRRMKIGTSVSGPKRTFRLRRGMSAIGGKADIAIWSRHVRF